MRYGENPTKFARHNPDVARLEFREAAPLSATSVTYVPHLTSCFREALDVLRLSLRSVRETIPVPFDLMVLLRTETPPLVAVEVSRDWQWFGHRFEDAGRCLRDLGCEILQRRRKDGSLERLAPDEALPEGWGER